MKKISTIIGLIALVSFHDVCQSKSISNAPLKIEKVTVYLSSAEIENIVTVNLEKGENEFVLTGAAGSINKSSIQIKSNQDVVVTSITPNENVISDKKENGTAFKDSIDYYQHKIDEKLNQLKVVQESIKVITTNSDISSDNASIIVTDKDIKSMADYTYQALTKLYQQKNDLTTERELLIQQLQRIQSQQTAQKDFVQTTDLAVKLFAKKSGRVQLLVRYVVSDCGWHPVYDFKNNGTNKPLTVFYKANVFQKTGVKWDNVHLSINTGSPDEDIQLPAMTPLKLVGSDYVPVQKPVVKFTPPVIKKGEEVNWAKDSVPTDNTLLYYTPATEENSSVEKYTTINEAGINASFDIDIPYTIPSDEQEYLVSMKKIEVAADYSYICRPSLDADVFLIAKIANWSKYNFLPGKYNLFAEDTRVGTGQLNPQNVADTLMVSLGRDKNFVVEKELDTKNKSEKTIGLNVNETVAYNINIRNTGTQRNTVTIEEQIPISRESQIEVSDINYSNGTYNEKTGKISWQADLKPSDKKQLHFGYNIKFPKGKRPQIVNE